jgi:hypothetical protein
MLWHFVAVSAWAATRIEPPSRALNSAGSDIGRGRRRLPRVCFRRFFDASVLGSETKIAWGFLPCSSNSRKWCTLKQVAGSGVWVVGSLASYLREIVGPVLSPRPTAVADIYSSFSQSLQASAGIFLYFTTPASFHILPNSSLNNHSIIRRFVFHKSVWNFLAWRLLPHEVLCSVGLVTCVASYVFFAHETSHQNLVLFSTIKCL